MLLFSCPFFCNYFIPPYLFLHCIPCTTSGSDVSRYPVWFFKFMFEADAPQPIHELRGRLFCSLYVDR